VKPEPGKPQSEAALALADESSAQARRFASAFELICRAIAERVFPGASLAVAQRGRLLAWEGFGRFTYEASSPEVRRETVWDLASLTKPIATASMAMLLYERGQLSLDTPVVDYLPEFGKPSTEERWDSTWEARLSGERQRDWRHRVSVAMLLAHSSGLPAHRKLYLGAGHSISERPFGSQAQAEGLGRAAILAEARKLPLEAEPGTRTEYSDMGFLVLGELLERVAGERLDRFCQRELFAPLTFNMMFSPQLSDRESIPPTVDDRVYRHRVVQGEVNDENASAMGGVAGHAGLFGDALSVARFAECMLHGGAPLFRPETVALFTARQASPEGASRTLGWDTPSSPSQSGALFSARSFGHLGYTGTSLWCDPERQLSVTLLTNRTWPDSRNQAIKQWRPKIHDAIVAALGA
jgi:serine-type D-Ala-D-Ala carboxypeptidase